jgi:hypothetical protein
MSLIQKALEKSSRAQATTLRTRLAVPKPWERDLAGEDLEEKIIQVQKNHIKQRSSRWRAAAGVMALFCIISLAGIAYVGISRSCPLPAVAAAPMYLPAAETHVLPTLPEIVPVPVPVEIFHLTGIMSLGGKPMAMINGKIVGEGDPLSGKAVVKQIGKGEVRLDVQGKEIKLTLS